MPGGLLRLSYVYLIGPDAGPFKIGRATSLKSRLTDIQVGCWEPVSVQHSVSVPATLGGGVERAMHKRFADDHIRGEWFRVPLDKLIAALDEIAWQATDDRAKSDHFNADECLHLCADPQAAFQALTRYRNDIAKDADKPINSRLLNKVGMAAHLIFTQVVVERRNLTSKFASNSRLARQAEGSLVQAMEGLVEVYRDVAAERTRMEDRAWEAHFARRRETQAA